jgi:hypothetical protein
MASGRGSIFLTTFRYKPTADFVLLSVAASNFKTVCPNASRAANIALARITWPACPLFRRSAGCGKLYRILRGLSFID